MKPRKTFDIYWNDDERERMEDSMRDYLDEDDLIDRERDLKQGQQDICDEYDEVEDADDLKDVL